MSIRLMEITLLLREGITIPNTVKHSQ